MKTTAVFKGHPIHQMLIPFPLAFLTGAFIFDVLAVITSSGTLSYTGGYLTIAGVIMAFAAAIPGFIDYLFSVPPKSSGKARATRHMLSNLSAVALFIIAFIERGSVANMPTSISIILELIGTGLLTAGGWLGGTLVNRNFIGPDHRYAGAGRWREATLDKSSGAVKAAEKEELKLNQMKLLRIGGKRIVLGRTETGYTAFDDHCTHRGGSLAGGVLICGTVQCLWHGSQFDVTTGAVKSGPAEKPISIYAVEENTDGIFINL